MLGNMFRNRNIASFTGLNTQTSTFAASGRVHRGVKATFAAVMFAVSLMTMQGEAMAQSQRCNALADRAQNLENRYAQVEESYPFTAAIFLPQMLDLVRDEEYGGAVALGLTWCAIVGEENCADFGERIVWLIAQRLLLESQIVSNDCEIS
jgi:hypothetical protein